MTAPTIEEQIAGLRISQRTLLAQGFETREIDAILASLEKLQSIESQPVPVEPKVIFWMQESQAKDTGHTLSSVDVDLLLKYLDSLQSALQRVQEQNRRMVELMKRITDKLEGAQSGYISCCAEDERWNAEKDALINESAELLKECGE